MRRWFIPGLIFLAVGIAYSWGNHGHELINKAAAGLVSGEFGLFLEAQADSLAVHGPDPDHWKSSDPDEGYRHYIDLDLYSEPPFTDFPNTESELIKKYGRRNVRRWGIVPYRIDQYSRVVIDLLAAGKWAEAVIPLAALGHYVADIHMPLHVVANYNGQLTGNTGIHFRWEVEMVDKYIDELHPDNPAYQIDDLLDECFRIARESYAVYPQLLRADSLARPLLSAEQQELLPSYDFLPDDSPYPAELYRQSGQLARDRMEAAATRVASFWLYCWTAAGKPTPQDSASD